MTATGDGEGVTVEQVTVVAEVPATEQPQQQEKKTKAAPKEQKPKEAKTASHPPYFQMIKDALLALNDRSGSSPYAIAKYMEEKHKEVLPANFRKILALQLKNSAGRGKLIKIKASYKLSEAANKEKAAAAMTDAARKPKKAKATTVAVIKVKKPETTKKPAKKKAGAKKVKKTTAAVAKVKQPRSIKSPAAKRAKKTTA